MFFKDTGEFLTVLADMIKRQWGRKEGPLLTTGYANIFYVRVAVGVVAVFVSRDSADREWGVDCYRLDDARWDDGDLVFARTAVA